MPLQKLKVTYADGREMEVNVTPKVEVAVERHYKSGLAALQKDAHAEHLYYLAWTALHYAHHESRSFEDFLDDLASVDLPDTATDETAGDPTNAGPLSAPLLS